MQIWKKIHFSGAETSSKSLSGPTTLTWATFQQLIEWKWPSSISYSSKEIYLSGNKWRGTQDMIPRCTWLPWMLILITWTSKLNLYFHFEKILDALIVFYAIKWDGNILIPTLKGIFHFHNFSNNDFSFQPTSYCNLENILIISKTRGTHKRYQKTKMVPPCHFWNCFFSC